MQDIYSTFLQVTAMAELSFESTIRELDFAGAVYFVKKKLQKSEVLQSERKNCQLAIPEWFTKLHEDKLRGIAVLNTTSSSIQGRMPLHSYKPRKFGKGWRAFAKANEIAVGDALILKHRRSTTMEVEFDVFIFHQLQGTTTQTSSTSTQLAAPVIIDLSSDSESSHSGKNDSSTTCSSQAGASIETQAQTPQSPRLGAAAGDQGGGDGDLRTETIVIGTVARGSGTLPGPAEVEAARQGMAVVGQQQVVQRWTWERQSSCTRTAWVGGEVGGGNRGFALPLSGDNSPADDHLREVVAKRKRVAECSASFAKVHLPDMENDSPSQRLHGLQSSQGRPVNHQGLRMPSSSAQNTTVVDSVLPSFIHTLAESNVHDSAGNSSGARFDIPLSFLKKHGIVLRYYVKLQGIREDSPSRNVTCSHTNMSLGWGDFVRDNILKPGQQLAFTLAADSFFIIREVSKIVVYTK